MKASVVVEPGVVEYREVDDPRPAEGEVLVEVAYCGVCGSDIPRVLMGTAHAYPIILGHEFSGTVAEVGTGVDRNLVGVRVTGVPLVPCMECEDCRAGDFALCGQYSFVGSRRPGAFAEYVCIPAGNVLPLSDKVGFREGAFFEPASVARHAIDIAGFQPGRSAVVVGCGTIGIFLVQILRGMGAARVVGLARREIRLNTAKAAGVEEVVNTSEAGWSEKLLATCDKGGFDYVFDTSGNADMMVESFTLAANGGVVCMVGTPKGEMTFPVRRWELLNRRELTIRGSWMSYSAPFPGREWADVARFFENGVLRLVPGMVDTVYGLEDMGKAFERFRSHAGISGKILCRCSAEG